MKLSDLRYFFSQPRPARRYGVDIERVSLAGEPPFDYAHWRNPRVERRIFDPGELFALRRFLRPGDFVVDVGAHAGDSAVAYAVVVGPEGCVLALEPNPLAFEVLARNAELVAPVGRIEPSSPASVTQSPGGRSVSTGASVRLKTHRMVSSSASRRNRNTPSRASISVIRPARNAL